jgi:hypothetical protein
MILRQCLDFYKLHNLPFNAKIAKLTTAYIKIDPLCDWKYMLPLLDHLQSNSNNLTICTLLIERLDFGIGTASIWKTLVENLSLVNNNNYAELWDDRIHWWPEIHFQNQKTGIMIV